MKGAVSSIPAFFQQPPVRSRNDGAAVLPQQPYQPCEPYDGIVLISDYTSVMPFKVCMSFAGLIRRMTFFSTTTQTIFFFKNSGLTARTIARIISGKRPTKTAYLEPRKRNDFAAADRPAPTHTTTQQEPRARSGFATADRHQHQHDGRHNRNQGTA